MYYAAMHHTKIIQEIFTNKTPPAGRIQAAAAAVTLPLFIVEIGA